MEAKSLARIRSANARGDADLAGQRGKLAGGQIDDRRGRRGFRRTLRLPAKGRALSFCRASAASSRASCSGSTKRTRRRAIRSRPASSRRRCPKASIGSPTRLRRRLAALGFLLALYRYDRFKADTAPKPRLVAPDAVDATRIRAHRRRRSPYGRDLVNAPANALGPDALEQEAVSSPSISTRASPWCAATT